MLWRHNIPPQLRRFFVIYYEASSSLSVFTKVRCGCTWACGKNKWPSPRRAYWSAKLKSSTAGGFRCNLLLLQTRHLGFRTFRRSVARTRVQTESVAHAAEEACHTHTRAHTGARSCTSSWDSLQVDVASCSSVIGRLIWHVSGLFCLPGSNFGLPLWFRRAKPLCLEYNNKVFVSSHDLWNVLAHARTRARTRR